MADPRARANAALEALCWDEPEAQVEWTALPYDIGRFMVGSFPTSASIVAEKGPARVAWHAGFRWCISAEKGALEWFDLKNRLRWRGEGEALNDRTLAGLTAESFARTGYLIPLEANFERASEDFSQDPSQRVATRIKEWWELSCQRHLTDEASPAEKERHKDRFTRFVSGILLLRTIEDMHHVSWLPQGRLRDSVSSKASSDNFRDLVASASERLNSRVIRGLARDLNLDVKRTIILDSYELGINFSALDVDPVGAFYEEILGVDYEHTPKIQRDLFGNNLLTREDRNARRAQGVYYTPRIYADTLARKLVRPRVRAAESMSELPVVTDIAAGSGELLCAALREILAEPLWRTQEVAWEVLNTKLHAVDQNQLALQLCALNLLRTAIRYVPELLDKGERCLPSLETNLHVDDALLQRTIDALPKPDIVLINPPFHTPNRWRHPTPNEAIPELNEVPAHPNKAIAFFAAAVRLARPGTGLGVVLPSNLFSGPLSTTWRNWLAKRVRIDLVVANYGTPFRDAHSYAGLLVGQKHLSNTPWRSRTRIVRINGNILGNERDTGALLGESITKSALVQSIIVNPIDEKSSDWLGTVKAEILVPHGKAPMGDVMGESFHEGVVLAPHPWRSKLLLFQEHEDGNLEHLFTKKKFLFRGSPRSPRLRPFVNAKKMTQRVPLWCEPVVENLWVFLPDGAGSDWLPIDSLRDKDPGGWELAKAIRAAILTHTPTDEIEQAYVDHAKLGEIKLADPKGYRDNNRTLVYASSTSPSAVGQGLGRAWRAWVNFDGDVVPVSGLQMRGIRPANAIPDVAESAGYTRARWRTEQSGPNESSAGRRAG